MDKMQIREEDFKLQLWRENKKLKAALRKAAEQVVSTCLGLRCPAEDCSAGNKSCVECRIRDWIELGDVATENIEKLKMERGEYEDGKED